MQSSAVDPCGLQSGLMPSSANNAAQGMGILADLRIFSYMWVSLRAKRWSDVAFNRLPDDLQGRSIKVSVCASI